MRQHAPVRGTALRCAGVGSTVGVQYHIGYGGGAAAPLGDVAGVDGFGTIRLSAPHVDAAARPLPTPDRQCRHRLYVGRCQ